jgi:hypothetical protein
MNELMGKFFNGLKVIFHQILGATPVSFWLALVMLLVGVIWFQCLPIPIIKYLNAEHGPFEQFSVAFLAAAALLACASWWQSRQTVWIAVAVVLVYATLRELDVQTLFTYRSVMSLGYFTRPRAPLLEKFVVLLAMAPCLIAIVHLWRRALTGWGHVTQLAMPLWILLLFVLSHFSDRTSWFRLQGHVEAFVEAVLAFAVLLMVVELKPKLLRQPDCGNA